MTSVVRHLAAGLSDTNPRSARAIDDSCRRSPLVRFTGEFKVAP